MPGENEPFFGRTTPPSNNVLRYVSGPEPESLDPQIGTGQVEQRIYLALFEGLVEYDPKTLEPIPAIAESWKANADSTEFIFNLRRNARWSNNEPITAKDFVYSIRRGLDPKTASRGAGQAYYILNAQAFNEGAMFVQDQTTGDFLNDETTKNRLTVPASEKARIAFFKEKPQLEQIIAGKNLVPVRAEDIGVEAVDDYTIRISLTQPVSFFVKMLAHNFFRLVPEKAISQFGSRWTQPENIVTSGAFHLKRWSQYHELIVEKNPYYWDATNVKLQQIKFYPIEEQPTVMNLYKAGDVDATYNRSVPRTWLFFITKKQDHQNEREAAINYYVFNTTKPPMNDARVRQAFSLAVDRRVLVATRPGAKILTSLIPPDIFTGYPSKHLENFNPELAKKLLAEAGFRDANGNYDPSKFPIDDVLITYNTSESNRFEAEIIQSQWKQNLGLTVSLKNMETKTYLSHATRLEYKGFARFGYKELLDRANQTLDENERNRLLSEAEDLFLKEQPILPLTTSTTNWLKKPYVKGMYPNALTLHPWKFVYIESDETKWDKK
jgi:ABC-type oligopeptide transport system substrate-binding subunit